MVIWLFRFGRDLGLRFSIPGLCTPDPHQGCVRTHPWTPPPRALPLDPTGDESSPDPSYKAASRFGLALLAPGSLASFSLQFNSAALRGIEEWVI
jgi:hypothetical protein